MSVCLDIDFYPICELSRWESKISTDIWKQGSLSFKNSGSIPDNLIIHHNHNLHHWYINSSGWVFETLDLRWPHRKRSSGVKSGSLGGHSIGPLLLIPNFSSVVRMYPVFLEVCLELDYLGRLLCSWTPSIWCFPIIQKSLNLNWLSSEIRR